MWILLAAMLKEQYLTGIVAANERQGRMICQENRDRRKYQAKPENRLRRHSFNQSRKLQINKGDSH